MITCNMLRQNFILMQYGWRNGSGEYLYEKACCKVLDIDFCFNLAIQRMYGLELRQLMLKKFQILMLAKLIKSSALLNLKMQQTKLFGLNQVTKALQ